MDSREKMLRGLYKDRGIPWPEPEGPKMVDTVFGKLPAETKLNLVDDKEEYHSAPKKAKKAKNAPATKITEKVNE